MILQKEFALSFGLFHLYSECSPNGQLTVFPKRKLNSQKKNENQMKSFSTKTFNCKNLKKGKIVYFLKHFCV